MPKSLHAELRYYWKLLLFRLREPFTDFRSTGITYSLYCFFVWLLSLVWIKFNSGASQFTLGQVFLYIGVTEMLFMSFLNLKQITGSTEDFVLFLARPRSWLAREIVGNIGTALGKRILFTLSLFALAYLLGRGPEDGLLLFGRLAVLWLVLALPQALLATLFSSLRLSYPQTDYFVFPFSKLFLALGGVFGPLSDYGEPWRGIFLQLPGADLFFQPAYFAVNGHLYETSIGSWLLRLCLIDFALFALVLFFYRQGRAYCQAWGG